MKTTLVTVGMAGLLALATLAGGCTATSPVEPTHYWESPEAVTKAEYNRSHADCSTSAGVALGEDTIASPSFREYMDCMITKGYTLQTY